MVLWWPTKRVTPSLRRQAYLHHREDARIHILGRLAHWNQYYGFQLGRVSIKDHRSVWGSCSSKGNLNFNYRLLFLPPVLADFVIVHELCHLKEPNHSASFWELVAQTFPDWRDHRRQLRTYRVI